MKLFKHKKKLKWFNKKPSITRRSNLQQKTDQKVISYYTASRRQLDNFERTSNLSQDNTLGKRRINKLKQAWFILIIVTACILVGIYLGTLNTNPHIYITGTTYRSTSEYQSIVLKQFSSDIRNRFKLSLNSKQLQNKISSNIPEAQAVIVKSSLLGHRPEVHLTMSSPLAVFQQPVIGNFILSERGRLLLAASQAKITDNKTPLSVINNNTGLEGKAGEQFMRPDEAKAFLELVKQYQSSGLNNVVYTLSNIPHELQAKEAGRGYYVRYLLDDTISQQYGALQATQKKLLELGNMPNEYIDVRLIEKIYYK
jgi:hypothetical protein